jgi:hypothetical protein
MPGRSRGAGEAGAVAGELTSCGWRLERLDARTAHMSCPMASVECGGSTPLFRWELAPGFPFCAAQICYAPGERKREQAPALHNGANNDQQPLAPSLALRVRVIATSSPIPLPCERDVDGYRSQRLCHLLK